jgi:hypothetical protein
VFTAPAAAVTDCGRHKTFVGTHCEAAKTIADMSQAAKGFPIFHNVSNLKVLSSRTIRATANSLACRVQLTLVYGGDPQTVSGTFSVHIFPNGRWTDNFDQTY